MRNRKRARSPSRVDQYHFCIPVISAGRFIDAAEFTEFTEYDLPNVGWLEHTICEKHQAQHKRIFSLYSVVRAPSPRYGRHSRPEGPGRSPAARAGEREERASGDCRSVSARRLRHV
jgi:hypothetical protein